MALPSGLYLIFFPQYIHDEDPDNDYDDDGTDGLLGCPAVNGEGDADVLATNDCGLSKTLKICLGTLALNLGDSHLTYWMLY